MIKVQHTMTPEEIVEWERVQGELEPRRPLRAAVLECLNRGPLTTVSLCHYLGLGLGYVSLELVLLYQEGTVEREREQPPRTGSRGNKPFVYRLTEAAS